MSGFVKVTMAALAAALLGACSQPPNPVIARDPIPPPTPADRVVCRSFPLILNGYWTECAPAGRTIVKERTVVRAKG